MTGNLADQLHAAMAKVADTHAQIEQEHLDRAQAAYDAHQATSVAATPHQEGTPRVH